MSIVLIAIVFFFGALKNIGLPGLYMDAVNPDYIVANFLSGNAGAINHFPPYDSFPVLGQLYHGMTHFYFGVVFFEFFGMNIFSLRLLHALFGLGILIATYILIFIATRLKRIALPIVLIFATDPALIFSFRTQTYITLTPMIWILLSVSLLLFLYKNNKNVYHEKWLLLISGWLFGFAFYGYFIYIFFAPAFLVAVYFVVRKNVASFKRNVAFWIGGVFLGSILYFYGYIRLIIEFGGFSGLLNGITGLNVSGHDAGFLDRLSILFGYMTSVLSGTFQYFMIFLKEPDLMNGSIKLYIIGIVIILASSLVVWQSKKNSLLNWFVVFVTSFYLIALCFATRLGSHHMVVIMPILYVGLGVAFFEIYTLSFKMLSKKKQLIATIIYGFIVVYLLALNINFQSYIQKNLVKFGGVGTYSDSLFLLVEDALRNPNLTYYVFDDWGFFAPFAFLTRGEIPYKLGLSREDLQKIECNKDLSFAYWGDKNDRINNFAESIGHVIDRKIYYQRDKAISFTVIRVSERFICGAE